MKKALLIITSLVTILYAIWQIGLLCMSYFMGSLSLIIMWFQLVEEWVSNAIIAAR